MSRKKPNNSLDSPFGRRGPGRPRRAAVYSEIVNRSENFRGLFSRRGVWEQLYPALKTAKTTQDVKEAFIAADLPDRDQFISLATLILRVMREPKFPRRPKPQIHFFADCLAACGRVAPRRSKDICDEYRKVFISKHHIIRHEYWVQCSCGYRGISTDHRCRKCYAPILE